MSQPVDEDPEGAGAYPKPKELLELSPLLKVMFDELKHSAGVGDALNLPLTSVECADDSLVDRMTVAAFALRKIQALHRLTKAGVRTKNSVVVTLAADLNLSLTELAGDALDRGHGAVHDLLIDGRNLINRASQVAATINRGEVVTLT